MKLRFGSVVAVFALAGAPASAQVNQPANRVSLPRWDAVAHVDLFVAHRPPVARCCDDWSHELAGGGGVGFYWTPNLKTEFDASAADESEHFVSEQVSVPGASFPAFRVGRRRYRDTTMSMAQVYQFFRNQWFHPMLGAGVDLQWERRRAEFDPLVVYRSGFRMPETLAPSRSEPPETEVRARPFVMAAFKAYLSERAFFRMDLKFAPAGDARQVSWRTGFGVDF